MNYRELKLVLDQMSEEQLDQTVTVYNIDMDEFVAVVSVEFSSETDNDVLDDNHAYLVTE